MTDTPAANADMAEFWDGERGEAWVARADQFDAQLEIYALRAIAAAAPQPGETVIDIGCGAGTTTLMAAQAVGATGRAVGIDISRPMLDLARRRAQSLSHTNVEFVLGDAQVMDPPDATADAVVSRFGVMFFDDPTAAFANIARMTSPGGRLSFVCWGPIEWNEWMGGPILALADVLTLPPSPPADAPGPFAFGDNARVEQILEASGWENVTIEDIADSIYLGGPGSVEDAADFLIGSSSLAMLLDGATADERAAARARLVETLAPQHDHIGVRYPALARLVHAVRAD
ncbi:MAG: methyltransferase domain-containing protein [Acidimicrobiales bacterium]